MRFDLNNEIERNRFKTKTNQLYIKGCIVELKEVKPKRSIKHNAYLHVCIQLYGIHFGHHLEDAKHELKVNCPFMHTFDSDVRRTRKTRNMNDKEIAEFIEWIRNFSSMQGCYIPTPEEYLLNQTFIDNEINRHKEFL